MCGRLSEGAVITYPICICAHICLSIYVYVYGHMGATPLTRPLAYVYAVVGWGYSAHSVGRQARKHLSYVTLELHSYRILCARPDVLGPVLVLQHTHTQRAYSLSPYTHTHTCCATFSAICAVFHVLMCRIWKFSKAHFARHLCIHTYVTPCVRVCGAHSSWKIVHLHYHNGNGFDLSARVAACT